MVFDHPTRAHALEHPVDELEPARWITRVCSHAANRPITRDPGPRNAAYERATIAALTSVSSTR